MLVCSPCLSGLFEKNLTEGESFRLKGNRKIVVRNGCKKALQNTVVSKLADLLIEN